MTNSGEHYAKLGTIRKNIEDALIRGAIPANIYLAFRDYTNRLWEGLSGCTISQVNAENDIDSLYKYLGEKDNLSQSTN
jgi:hypothetical protein